MDLEAKLQAIDYDGKPLRVKVDRREIRGGAKAWGWVKKGVPIRIEIGPRDIESNQVCLSRRDKPYGDKSFVAIKDLANISEILDDIHQGMYKRASAFLEDNTIELDSLDALLAHFDEGKLGFVKVPYAGGADEESTLHEHKISIRCLLDSTPSKCVFTGQDTDKVAVIAKAY